MYCAKALQLACRCLPQRLKPQTAGRTSFFRFSLSVLPDCSGQFFSKINQISRVPFSRRAKNQYFLGLLALLFLPSVCNTIREEIL